MINETVSKEWQEAINEMSYEELQKSLEDPSYYQEYKELVKKRMAEIEQEMTHVSEVFIKALKKRRCKYELEDDNKVHFTYSRKKFYAELDLEYDYVSIYFIHDIHVNKEDKSKLSRLISAVNDTNRIGGETTYYCENTDTGNVFVVSSSILNFISHNPNFEMEFGMALEGCLISRDTVKTFMKRKYNKRNKLDD